MYSSPVPLSSRLRKVSNTSFLSKQREISKSDDALLFLFDSSAALPSSLVSISTFRTIELSLTIYVVLSLSIAAGAGAGAAAGAGTGESRCFFSRRLSISDLRFLLPSLSRCCCRRCFRCQQERRRRPCCQQEERRSQQEGRCC